MVKYGIPKALLTLLLQSTCKKAVLGACVLTVHGLHGGKADAHALVVQLHGIQVHSRAVTLQRLTQLKQGENMVIPESDISYPLEECT